MTLLGIDTGGTFTDFVYYNGQDLITHKVLSSPDDPVRAIMQGLQDMGITLQGLRVVHGSTVATNAVLEGKGARTAYITNRGFADVVNLLDQFVRSPSAARHGVNSITCSRNPLLPRSRMSC